MKTSLFDYKLPAKLIAQTPLRYRDRSRLLILDCESGKTAHRRFRNIIDYIRPGDALVVNNTRVFKARLIGRRQTGAKTEIFLVRPIADSPAESWLALVSPSKRLREGETISFGDRSSVTLDRHRGEGVWQVSFSSKRTRQRIIRLFGHVPLPPYIRRDDSRRDIRTYQTVYAASDREGAVAAPTAGLHFTKPLLGEIRAKGISIIEVTLHVGPGTFKPIKSDRIENHSVDSEYAELNSEAANKLNRVRSTGGAVIAVGTTSMRTLESATLNGGEIQPYAGMVNLYIRPGHRFGVVDRLLTNFHLPCSSLLVLVSAFAGRKKVLDAYAEAIEQEYRFYSYGDAMFILKSSGFGEDWSVYSPA